MFDLRTGIELEWVLPKGRTRFDLLPDGYTPFEQFSKVPMPPLSEEAAEVVQNIARHHDAEVQSIAPDLSCFYLRHRAGRSGPLAVVHDNTIAGGERVAEVVTDPLTRDQLPILEAVCERARSLGAQIPETAALHVHLDGARFLAPLPLARLMRLYDSMEAELFRFVDRPQALSRAGPTPDGIIELVERIAHRGGTWEETLPWLRSAYDSRDFGLNLYNLAHGIQEKLTVELKIAGSTMDAKRVVEIRELYVRMAEWALGEDPVPSSLAAFTE